VVEEIDPVEDDERPSSSKRRRSGLKNQGRKRNGTDFWSRVDRWFEEAKEERGSDFTLESWRM
jgi:hypothetical protein